MYLGKIINFAPVNIDKKILWERTNYFGIKSKEWQKNYIA